MDWYAVKNSNGDYIACGVEDPNTVAGMDSYETYSSYQQSIVDSMKAFYACPITTAMKNLDPADPDVKVISDFVKKRDNL